MLYTACVFDTIFTSYVCTYVSSNMIYFMLLYTYIFRVTASTKYGDDEGTMDCMYCLAGRVVSSYNGLSK